MQQVYLNFASMVLEKVELVLTNFVQINFSLFFHTIAVTCDDNLWQTIYGFFRSWWMSLFNIKCKRLQLCQSSLKRVSRDQVLLLTNVRFHTKETSKKRNLILAVLFFKMEDMFLKLTIASFLFLQ